MQQGCSQNPNRKNRTAIFSIHNKPIERKGGGSTLLPGQRARSSSHTLPSPTHASIRRPSAMLGTVMIRSSSLCDTLSARNSNSLSYLQHMHHTGEICSASAPGSRTKNIPRRTAAVLCSASMSRVLCMHALKPFPHMKLSYQPRTPSESATAVSTRIQGCANTTSARTSEVDRIYCIAHIAVAALSFVPPLILYGYLDT